MARGSKPGERRGGRKKGTPNLKTIEKKILEAREAGAKGAPVILGKETLAEFVVFYRGMAAKYQPKASDNPYEMDEKTLPIWEDRMNKFERWSKLAVECAKYLAPYQSPTFRSVHIQGDMKPTDELEVIELTIFDDHNKVIEHRPGERPSLPAPVDDDE